ncbi:hypothetical protein HYALB_00010132 [Hymenoscyphus albidus]|uniref:RRM domain-containing protein n=1 Tax=Hymenoscyphus albidus TaxID=595503 RepID=A0A9N9LEF7_9HELO|nr:hypothetical protein HYALB_00010132 [Hymenoscyphus albidus]
MPPRICTDWKASAYPELVWALEDFGLHPDQVHSLYMDSWLTNEGIDIRKVIPATPLAYNRDIEEERMLYILGFPDLLTPIGMRNFINDVTELNIVEKCVVVVDTVSQCSFRWVVLTSALAADYVIERCHNLMVVDWARPDLEYTLHVCRAVGPRKHVNIYAPTSPIKAPVPITREIERRGRVLFQDTNPAPGRAQQLPRIIETVHGHPSPPQVVSSSPLHYSPPRRLPTPVQEPDEQMQTPKSWKPEDDIGLDDDEEDEPPAPVSTFNKTPPQIFVTQAASWAAIANTANPNAQLIELHPGKQANRSKSGGLTHVVAYGGSRETRDDTIRVVFLLDLPSNITTQDISDAIHEGPLRSISFGFDEEKGTRFAGVIFQYAVDAELFHSIMVKERAESRPSRFRFTVEAVRGEPFPCDEYLRLMDPPTYASRRLTIVKSRFFFMFGERQLKALCEKLVGRDTVQLIWLYNGGNATIVFADVPSAVTVKNALDRMAAGIGLPSGQSPASWDGLQTTFSKDPCAVPLEFKTAMN